MSLGAARRLDPEGLSQQDSSSYRQSQHEAHGCCQDAGRLRRRGVYLGPEPGRTLVGIESLTPLDRQSRAMAIPLRCRSWRCSCCAVSLRRRARARAFMGSCGARVALLTLTIDPSDGRFADPVNRAGKARPLDPRAPNAYVASESVRYASWAFNRFRTYLVREYGAVPYFRGVELQKSGMAHLHVLLRLPAGSGAPAAFLGLRAKVRGPEWDRSAGLAVRAGFGKVVDMQLARSGGDVARYVTKASSEVAGYVTKGLAGGMPRYTRRSSWSRSEAAAWAPGWVKPAPISGFTWRLAKASVGTVSDALWRSEFVVVDPAFVRGLAPVAAGGI